MTQILPHRSVRFFPHWDGNDIHQVIGLIEMINYIFEQDPSASHWVEIGSLCGESSTIFLGFNRIKKLDCIDSSEPHTLKLKTKFASYIKSKRCFIHNFCSKQCAAQFKNESIDVVYIDGDHSYEGVKEDIKLYYPKLKHGGFLCGHDYSAPWPSIIQAVDEFVLQNKKQLITFKDSSWLIRK